MPDYQAVPVLHSAKRRRCSARDASDPSPTRPSQGNACLKQSLEQQASNNQSAKNQSAKNQSAKNRTHEGNPSCNVHHLTLAVVDSEKIEGEGSSSVRAYPITNADGLQVTPERQMRGHRETGGRSRLFPRNRQDRPKGPIPVRGRFSLLGKMGDAAEGRTPTRKSRFCDEGRNCRSESPVGAVRSRPPENRLLDELFLFFVAVGGDFAGVFESADDVDDLLLRLFDVRETHRAEIVHFLA